MRPRPSLCRRALAFLLIACFSCAWALPALVQSQEQMSCCRKGSDHSCCRRTQTDTQTLTAANACGTRCNALAATPLPPLTEPEAANTDHVQASAPLTIPAPVAPEPIRITTCQLHQRPPPPAA